MNEQLNTYAAAAIEAIKACENLKDLETAQVKFLGKKSELTNFRKSLGDLPKDERPIAGKLINDMCAKIEETLGEAKEKLWKDAFAARLRDEEIDVTLPGTRAELGSLHPLTIATEKITSIFMGMGFSIADGPEIEDFYHNFDALNIPETHTAREEADTFYVEGGLVLRSATSTVQVRVMEKMKPPIKIIAPGKVYRSDAVDATHSPIFHQLEGLVIDKGVTMGDLKGALSVFAREMFGDTTVSRFRPHYFPFTEPSAEMDVSCFNCEGEGCRICGNSGYIELLGCGMVHPNVLKMSGIDPDIYSGYAFGMGLERSAMRMFNITDLRLMYENDIRFLRQFA